MTPPAADASKRISEAAPNQTPNAHHAHRCDAVEGCELSSSLGVGIPRLRATIGGLRAWDSMSAAACGNFGVDPCSNGCDCPVNCPVIPPNAGLSGSRATSRSGHTSSEDSIGSTLSSCTPCHCNRRTGCAVAWQPPSTAALVPSGRKATPSWPWPG